jgi:hypothetical protein
MMVLSIPPTALESVVGIMYDDPLTDNGSLCLL